MLVVPTVTARQLADRFPSVLVLAGLIGAAVGVTGALTATRGQLPTGPVVVLTGFAVALAALLLAPGRGVLWQARRLASRRRIVRRDAVLAHPDAPATSLSDRLIRAGLRRRGLLAADGTLTATGRAAAAETAERRALWSAWLEHGPSIRLPDAREPDPVDLAGSLGEDAVAQLRKVMSGNASYSARVHSRPLGGSQDE
jgi:manganese/zinc/iron transport system permease protein